jgi:tetratricopeptide (TPR) repeat protein
MATKFFISQNNIFCVFVMLLSGMLFSSCGQSIVRRDQVQVDDNQDLINQLKQADNDFNEIKRLIYLSDEDIERMTETEKTLNAKKLYSYGCPVRSQSDTLALKTSLKILLKNHSNDTNIRLLSGIIINEYCWLGDFKEARKYIENIEISNPDIDYSFEKAMILFKLDEKRSALFILEKILNSLNNKTLKGQDLISQQIFKSMILFLLDRHQESIEIINKLSVNFPNEPRIKLIKQKLLKHNKDDLINYLLHIN